MTIEVGTRPAQLHGCWRTWDEQDISAVIATEMESGVLHTRRRFTGVSRVANVSVTYPKALYSIFMDWFRINQKQGSIATWVVTPYGDEEVFQFTSPPKISWPDPEAFSVSVTLFQGAHF